MLRLAVFLSNTNAHYRRMIQGIHAWATANHAGVRHVIDPMPVGPGAPPVDGLISQAGSLERQQRLLALPYPSVVVTGKVAPIMPAVLPDGLAIGRLAAEHLMDLGLRRLAWCGEPFWFASQRQEGFSAACRQRNLAPAVLLLDEVVGFVLGSDEVVGIACANDATARAVVQVLHDAGIQVPGRCAVMGVDNDDLYVATSPVPLTSVDIDSTQIGWRAAELVAAMAQGRAAPTSPVLIEPRGLVARQSTDLIAVADPALAAAVRTMRLHACKRQTIAQMLHAMPMSRRTFERVFRQTFGRAPAEEIERLRMVQARRLLRETEMPIAGIARQCGFGSARAFIRAFGRCHGRTPGEFRERLAGVPNA